MRNPNVITRKEARKAEVLRLLETKHLSNVQLAELLGLKYRAVQAATAELSAENKIIGYLVGTERYGCIEWRLNIHYKEIA